MWKNAKQLLSQHCQQEKIPLPLYECKPDKEGQPNGFFCTVKIVDKSFTIPEYEKSKKAAEMSAANMACSQMNITHSSVEAKKVKPKTSVVEPQNPPKKVKPTEKIATVKPQNQPVKAVKDPDWVTIEKVEDLYKYLPDEVLAKEFKAFLNCKAQEENKGHPVFTASEVEDNRYIAAVVYDGVTYDCLGPMVTKKQAEQSAAETCLRTIGDFPNVTKDKYTIQQYHDEPYTAQQRNQKNPFFMLLCQCAVNLKLQHPIRMHKVVSSGEIPLYTVALQFEGRIFKSKTPATSLVTGREEASIEAIKYLGVADPEEASTLKQSIGIPVRYRRKFSLMTPFASPLLFSPSKRTGWATRHLASDDEMTGNEFVIGDDEKILRIRPSSTQDVNQIFDRAMKVDPRFNGSLLSECSDIVVAEVNRSNKSSTIVGNQKFSIQMFAENGKILSTTKGSLVDLLPGQNFRGLKCSYQLMYPSLQVYLKAESCTDVTKPRKLLPVVTSCGVAMLIYDHEAHTQDINILLTRPYGKLTFVSRSNYFKSYLNAAITSANTSSTFTVAECVKNITTWTAKEVQLMSEMTVESMKQLLSVSVSYDERWSELFQEKQTDVLKELKAAAVTELSHRKTEGAVDVGVEEEWCLPATAFQHTLCNYGVYMENDVRCAFRSAVQITGTKVKLADLEESKIVDVPVKSANKGAVCRYYVWKGIRKVSGDEQEPYYNEPTDVTAELGEGWMVDGKSVNPNRYGDETRSHNRPADEEGKVPMKPDATSFNKPVHMECRWVPLEEAKKICPILKTIASKTPFKDQVFALQHDANNFGKEKQVNQEAV